MDLSRRDALRAGAGLVAGGALAGCVERRVTRRETNVDSSTTWTLTPGTGAALDADEFDAYVDEMESVYGESGVWGLGDAENAEFETAYAQRLPVVRESSGQPGGAQPSLSPDDIDRASNFPVVDAAVSMYRLDDGVARYWLWAAIDVRNETFARDAAARVLSTGVSVRDSTVTTTASLIRDDDAAIVDHDGQTVRRFPLGETTNSIGTDDRTELDGYYVAEWRGSVDGIQSLNGFCEVDRTGDYDVSWTVGGGYRVVERV